tara:strand:+ start:251 stop:400 length:150 start_codon:yes stop_codon:yes gene_type:complete
MTQKYLNQIFSERNERTSSRECMSACMKTEHEKEYRIPFMEKTLDVFNI